MSPVVDTMVGAGGARLRTLRWEVDEPAGRVLLVHGFGDHAGRYATLAEALNERGYALFAYDQRGHGGSEGKRGHAASFGIFLEDLQLARAKMDERAPASGPPFLMGHSFGGLVVLRYLQTHRPDAAGAVVQSPWLETATEIPLWKRAASRVLQRLAPDLTLDSGISAELLTRDPEKVRQFEEDPLVHHRISAGFFAAVRDAQERVRAEGLPPGLPVLFLVPGADGLVDSEVTLSWARGLPSADVEVRELEGRPHEPHNDLGREEVFEILGRWLDAHRGRG